MTNELLCLVAVVAAEPSPGRIPKVYNALITSNQNLEPSKAYPIYQPVLHDFAFPFQSALFYGDFPIGNSIHRVPALLPKEAPPSQQPMTPKSKEADIPPSSEVPPPPPESTEKPEGEKEPAAPAPMPSTESPIPLNEFGLPPQIIPLGRIDPAYEGFTQLGPFTYSYPSFRFYDPFDPFNVNPYGPISALYRPFANVLGQTAPVLTVKEAAPTAAPLAPIEQNSQTPPPEPIDLNILNFSSKDPAIPNVPPPPLPQGGLKSDKSE